MATGSGRLAGPKFAISFISKLAASEGLPSTLFSQGFYIKIKVSPRNARGQHTRQQKPQKPEKGLPKNPTKKEKKQIRAGWRLFYIKKLIRISSFARLPQTCSKQLFIIMFWLFFWSTVWGSTSKGLLRKGFRLCALRLA